MPPHAELHDLVSFSDALLERERCSLIERVGQLKQRVETHRTVLEQLESQLAADQALLREVEELTDRRPQMRLERLDRELRGRRLREVAVDVLRRRGEDDALHYREWFSLLRAEGWEVRGRDPLNTFLTEVGRADGVERVGQRTGFYRLAL
jgi:vacuolar-type H+-ATPase subunit I/STV1